MSLKVDVDKFGRIYLDGRGKPHLLLYHCMEPTATMEEPISGGTIGGSFSSLNMQPFRPLADCSREEIETALILLIDEARTLREQQIGFKEQILSLKVQLYDRMIWK